MSLTVSNAAAALGHREGHAGSPGYTRTLHHIGHVSPGDLWYPDPLGLPHTVITVNRRAREIVLTDQFGIACHYPPGAVIGTAVPDPRIRVSARTAPAPHAA